MSFAASMCDNHLIRQLSSLSNRTLGALSSHSHSFTALFKTALIKANMRLTVALLTPPAPLSATGYVPQPTASPALLLETQRTPQIAPAIVPESMEEQRRSGFFARPRLFTPQRQLNATVNYHIIGNLYFKIELRDIPLFSMTHNLYVFVN